jgi:CspA family cold shock protein
MPATPNAPRHPCFSPPAPLPLRGTHALTQYEGFEIMPTGTVKWFNTTKGFGFIAPDEGGKDVFVHISAVERAGWSELPDDLKVSYELREGRDGRESAVELVKVDL